MKKEEKKKLLFHRQYTKSFLMYTILFMAISLFLILIFKKYNKEFIWNVDGRNQHIVTLKYFRELLIGFFRTGSISTFTWNIGLGFSFFANLAYYILGDVFSYISVCVPTSKVEMLYNILVIVRMYFVGIAFLLYCRYKKMNGFASVIGGLMYTFCSFTLYAAVRHPYFINAMIMFPLVLTGIDKIILEDKPIYYCIIIAITFTMNFYFAYMIALVIAIYGIALAICTYKEENIKKIVKVLLKTLFYSILGIAISSIILLPTLISFFNSERSTASVIYPYSLSYYRTLASNLLSLNENAYWVVLGVQSIFLISLPIFIRKRKDNYPIFIVLVVLLLALLISQIGSIFCGFSYPNNRWTFIVSFILSFITTSLISDNRKLDKKDLIAIGIFALVYLGINIIFDVGVTIYTEIQIGIAILILLFMINKNKLEYKFKKVNLYHILLMIVFVLGIFSSVKYKYDVEGEGYVSEFLNYKEVSKIVSTSAYQINDFSKAIDYIQEIDKDFYRVSKYPYAYANVSLMNKKYNAIGHYYSITPNLYGKLNTDLRNSQYYLSEGFREFDYRTKITTLLGVKYCIAKGNATIPYGYSVKDDYEGKSKVYINNYSLPFGVLYDSYITNEEYDNLTSLKKESSLLKTTVVDKNIASQTELIHEINNDNNNIKEINYEIIDENSIVNQNSITISNEKNNSIKLNFSDVKNSEIYVCFKNLKYSPYTANELMEVENDKKNSIVEKEKNKNKYQWYQPHYDYVIKARYNDISKTRTIKNYLTSPYCMDDSEILLNMGYYVDANGMIIIEFSKVGHYQWDDIKIYAVSMEDYEEDIKELKRSNFETISYENGYMKGTVDAEVSGILQFSTIYDKGWKVYVDGEQVDTFESNKYFLGIYITKGEHIVELKYETPYLKVGAVISIIGITILAGVTIFKRKNNKEKL